MRVANDVRYSQRHTLQICPRRHPAVEEQRNPDQTSPPIGSVNSLVVNECTVAVDGVSDENGCADERAHGEYQVLTAGVHNVNGIRYANTDFAGKTKWKPCRMRPSQSVMGAAKSGRSTRALTLRLCICHSNGRPSAISITSCLYDGSPSTRDRGATRRPPQR